MESTIEEKKSPNKFIKPIIGILILGCAAYFAYTKISYAQHNEDTENSQIECNIVPVAARISGYVEEVYVVENLVYINSVLFIHIFFSTIGISL